MQASEWPSRVLTLPSRRFRGPGLPLGTVYLGRQEPQGIADQVIVKDTGRCLQIGRSVFSCSFPEAGMKANNFFFFK